VLQGRAAPTSPGSSAEPLRGVRARHRSGRASVLRALRPLQGAQGWSQRGRCRPGHPATSQQGAAVPLTLPLPRGTLPSRSPRHVPEGSCHPAHPATSQRGAAIPVTLPLPRGDAAVLVTLPHPSGELPSRSPCHFPAGTLPSRSPHHVPEGTLPSRSPCQFPEGTLPSRSPCHFPEGTLPSRSPCHVPEGTLPSWSPCYIPEGTLPSWSPCHVPEGMLPPTHPATSQRGRCRPSHPAMSQRGRCRPGHLATSQRGRCHPLTPPCHPMGSALPAQAKPDSTHCLGREDAEPGTAGAAPQAGTPQLGTAVLQPAAPEDLHLPWHSKQKSTSGLTGTSKHPAGSLNAVSAHEQERLQLKGSHRVQAPGNFTMGRFHV